MRRHLTLREVKAALRRGSGVEQLIGFGGLSVAVPPHETCVPLSTDVLLGAGYVAFRLDHGAFAWPLLMMATVALVAYVWRD